MDDASFLSFSCRRQLASVDQVLGRERSDADVVYNWKLPME